jgi:hypothetical protein
MLTSIVDLTTALEAGEDEEVVEQPAEPVGLGDDIRPKFVPGLRIEPVADPLEERRAAVHRGHRGPQLMGEEAEKGISHPVAPACVGHVPQE